ncbi:MAG TPA: glycosyltransferase family A protein, partial [Novosphingobium sp.]|nr:glycosyltransferase family A protein [Novosphingobium sp.]
SMPQASDGIAVHVVVNGSTDRTAQIARTFPVTVHDWAQGGKARSWNRFVLDTPGIEGEAFVFVDGDAEVVPGSIEALARTLADHPQANAASGLAANGSRAEAYRRELIASRGLFGDLYALSGSFVARLRASGIRLPEDPIGDDSLVGALAKTGLADESDWRDDRIVPCPQAGFLCEPTALTSLASLRGQYARMVNYAVRHFQNRMVSQIMREAGPQGLPRRMAELYPEWLPRLAPRFSPVWFWFDRKALARMRAASPSS